MSVTDDPPTVAPLDGAVRATDGGVVSGDEPPPPLPPPPPPLASPPPPKPGLGIGISVEILVVAVEVAVDVLLVAAVAGDVGDVAPVPEPPATRHDELSAESLARVRGPTLPRAGMPLALWIAATAAEVSVP